MNVAIMIRENSNSKYQVFDGEILLACFGSKSAAEEYAKVAQATASSKNNNRDNH